MTSKVQMQSKNRQTSKNILKEQKKYRVVDQPKFSLVSPSTEIREMPEWFFKILIVATPIMVILLVSLVVVLLHA